MKAIYVETPDGTVSVRDVTEPALATDYDCRVAIAYGTICAGTDGHILHDRLPWEMPYPLVLGHESVGRVVQAGPKVRHFKVGDLIARVGTAPATDGSWNIGWGGFAEFGFCRDWRAMQEDGLEKALWEAYRINQVIPDDIPQESGPLFITLRETLSYTQRLGIGEGTRLLIVGSGGNALAFVAHAKRLGAAQIVVIGSAARESVFREAGASGYVNYKALEGITEKFDRVIDTVGKETSSDDILPFLADGAVLGIYGLDDWEKLTLRPARTTATFTIYQGGYDEPETHDAIVEGFRKGDYQRTWWTGEAIFTLHTFPQALAAIESRELIKPLIRINPTTTINIYS
jgi:D-arabinose 1-dehydrogenase-like Zn-dependent alcohol dehydrogenase